MSAETHMLNLEEIREELLELDSPTDRLGVLIELGHSLPAFPPEACIEENRVLGCQSLVWLVSKLDGERLTFAATSDAPMVRGLIAILLAAYSNKLPSEILSFPIEDFFESIKLTSFITPMRSNGLFSMIQRIREIATQAEKRVSTRDLVSNERRLQLNMSSDAESLQTNSKLIKDCRLDFPILLKTLADGQPLTYLDNAASSQRPQQVIVAMSRVYEEHYSNVHRSGHQLAAKTTSEMEAARESIRSFLNARETAEIVYTSGTTSAINLVARAWGDAHVRAGDEILLTEMEHHSNIVPWQQLAERTGAVIRWIPIRDDYQLDIDLLPTLLTRRTKIVAVTAVSNVLGTINPVRHIVDAAHAVGCRVLVDAAQAVPHAGCDVQTLDADFVVFSGHKMLGPNGIGVLYGKRSVLELMPPFLGGGNMIKSVSLDGFVAADIPHRFEAGTAPIVEAIAMRPAIEYLRSIGTQAIIEQERALVRRAHRLLENIEGVNIFGPAPDKKTGIVSFAVDGMHPQDIEKFLDAKGIAVRVGHHCAMPLHNRLGVSATCRASFYFYNTLEEVDRFGDAIQQSLSYLR